MALEVENTADSFKNKPAQKFINSIGNYIYFCAEPTVRSIVNIQNYCNKINSNATESSTGKFNTCKTFFISHAHCSYYDFGKIISINTVMWGLKIVGSINQYCISKLQSELGKYEKNFNNPEQQQKNESIPTNSQKATLGFNLDDVFNKKDKNGNNALHQAAFDNDIELIEKVLQESLGNQENEKYIFDTNKQGFTLLDIAYANHNIEVLYKVAEIFDNNDQDKQFIIYQNQQIKKASWDIWQYIARENWPHPVDMNTFLLSPESLRSGENNSSILPGDSNSLEYFKD